jgi:hypothetical protein
MMKSIYGLLVALVVVCISNGEAQVTNLIVNSSSSNFTFVSGDAVSWSYNLPTGATASCEFWFDANQNGTIDPATDVVRFTFTQTDGDPNGNGGPPDMDGSANGSISFSQPVGFGPGKYLFKVTHNGTGLTISGTVTALASPAHLISGHITPPAGKSPQYINVEVHRNDQFGNPNFWDTYTDVNGDYTIQMNADTLGNPWQIRMETNPFPPSIISPDQIELTITGNHSGNNFTFIQAAAQVSGIIKDENGGVLSNFGVQLRRNDGNVQHQANSNASGLFQIGLQSSELTGQTWYLETDCNCQNGGTGSILTTQVQLPIINSTDSLYRQLTVYSVNSQIQGQVRLNGTPLTFSMQIMAINPDTAFAETQTDSGTGNFTIPVSDKIHNYQFMFAGGLPFGWEVQQTIAHPGDTGVIVNIVTQTNVLINWADSWNMLSVPVKVIDNQKTTLFPSATSPAFSYSGAGGYQQQSNLFNGIGYWMKFSGSNSASINGTYSVQETVAVATGWNMIGGPSCSIQTSHIVALGTTVVSPYFGYSGGYAAASTLEPGYAYWVKCSGTGQLILDCNNTAAPANERIHMLIDEYPPPPPGYIESKTIAKPVSDALLENYPNPFNPTTEIKYQIAGSKFVSLKIYNVMGQEISTMVNEEQQPGFYSVTWDASAYPSGVYYYRLTARQQDGGQAGEYSATRKLVLMK